MLDFGTGTYTHFLIIPLSALPFHYSSLCVPFSPVSHPQPSPVSPLRLPGERCPGFSHDRSVPCRFELHILSLFKVTDCCMPNSPLKHSPMSFSHSLQYKAHTIPTDQTPSYPYKLYQRIARNKYEGENVTSSHRALYKLSCKYGDAAVYSVFIRDEQILWRKM